MWNRDMEDSYGTYNHGAEFRGLHVNNGNAYVESNGQRGRVDPLELVEFMRILEK
jgi:hypothetical protein